MRKNKPFSCIPDLDWLVENIVLLIWPDVEIFLLLILMFMQANNVLTGVVLVKRVPLNSSITK